MYWTRRNFVIKHQVPCTTSQRALNYAILRYLAFLWFRCSRFRNPTLLRRQSYLSVRIGIPLNTPVKWRGFVPFETSEIVDPATQPNSPLDLNTFTGYLKRLLHYAISITTNGVKRENVCVSYICCFHGREMGRVQADRHHTMQSTSASDGAWDD